MRRPVTKRGISTWVLLVASLVAARIEAADVLVVCPPAFRKALASWERYREGQGLKLLVIEPSATSSELKDRIHEVTAQNPLRFIVLVGDVRRARDDVSYVPTCYAKAQVNVRWGSEPTIATDEPYSEIGEGHAPGIAIGRIPAHTPDELSTVVRKIIGYEQNADEGLWHRRINLVAGVGGFGPMTDALIEGAGRSVIQQIVPASYDVAPLFAGSAKPGSPPPDQFTDSVCGQLSEGSLAWIYLGHGLPTELDSIHTSVGDRPIMSASEVPRLRCGANSPLAILIACYTGALDARQGCLAERFILHEQGPVAVVAATRVTMPYGNAVFGCELLRSCFNDRPATLGELWTQAQRRTLAETPDDQLRKSLDALAAGLSPAPVDLAGERREHVLMYQLFGDPLLRMQYPHDLDLATTPEVAVGQPLIVDGRSDLAGECTVELISNRGGPNNPTPTATIKQSIEPGQFRATLLLPPDAAGQYTLRAFVAGKSDFAMGATSVNLNAMPAPMSARAATTGTTR